MRDYSMHNEEKKNFILNFKDKENQLLVHYTDFKSIFVDTNQKQEILKRIEIQVKNSCSYEKKQKKNIKPFLKNTKASFLCNNHSCNPIINIHKHFILSYLTTNT